MNVTRRRNTPELQNTESDTLQQRHVAFIRAILLGLLGILLLLVILNVLIIGPDALSLQGLGSILAVGIVVGFALMQLDRGHFRQAVGIVTGAILLLLAYEVAEDGIRGSSELLLGFTVPITFAGLLLGRRALIVTCAVSTAAVVMVRVLERNGILAVASDASQMNPDMHVILFVLIIGLLALIIDRFGVALKGALDAAVARGRDLTDLNAELQRQIDERRQAELARDQSEERLQFASQAVGIGVWSWDLTTGESTWSDSYRELLGLPAGTPASIEMFLERVHPEDRAALKASTQNIAGLSDGSERDFRIVLPDGQVRWLASRYRLMRDTDDRPVQMSGVLYDVTARKQAEHERARLLEETAALNEQLEQRVEQRTAQLQEANRELEAFSYSVSHDLRAPLRGIDGFSQALEEDYGKLLDDTAKTYLHRIRAGANRMGELIDDLLHLSRVARSALTKDKVNLSGVARQVLLKLQQAQPERRVTLQIQDGTQVEGDRRLLTVALENLLGNAWKFTQHQAHPCIEFGMKQGDPQVYYVRDNGAGFDMAYANKLFVPFQRLHDHNEFEGTGIGLATVQRIIHRHGGRIWAEGEEGSGATFYFTLNTDQGDALDA